MAVREPSPLFAEYEPGYLVPLVIALFCSCEFCLDYIMVRIRRGDS